MLVRRQAEIFVLAKVEGFDFVDTPAQDNETVLLLNEPLVELRVNLDGLVDRQEELGRLTKEIEKSKSDLEKVLRKLSSKSFVEKAPQPVVDQENERKTQLSKKIEELDAAIHKLGSK